MMRRWLWVATALIATGVVQARAEVKDCASSAIEVYALPPTVSVGGHGHLLVMEAQNVGATACRLESSGVDLVPHIDGTRIMEWTARGSESALALADTPLEASAWAHFVVVWMDVGAPEVPCEEHSTLKMGVGGDGYGEREPVEVRNLWMHSCMTTFVSDWRKGHFAGNVEPSKDWMASHEPVATEELEFPGQLRWGQIASEAKGFQVHTPLQRTMLGDNVQVRVRFPRGADGGCAYRWFRKRESSGATVIEMQNCRPDAEWKAPAVPMYGMSGVARVETRNSHLDAEHVGGVRYDVLAQVGSFERPKFVMGGVGLRVDDPAQPKLPVLMNEMKMCSIEDLQFRAGELEHPQRLVNVRTYTATNVSAAQCAVAGVPAVKFREANGETGWYLPTVCPNCENPAFAPRPNGRIDLKPGQSAHVLVATAELDTA